MGRVPTADRSYRYILSFRPNSARENLREQQMALRGMFFYDEDIPYVKEEWIGRLKASACLGASLSKSKIIDFEAEMKELLEHITKDQFAIRHRVDSHIFQFK